MKNLKLLKTGGKPAPGNLIVVQGFVNTYDVEAGIDEIGTKDLLKSWMVRHGLFLSSETISDDDFRQVILFRESIRSLLQKNNGSGIKAAAVSELNQLASRYLIGVKFKKDGSFSLSPAGQGISRFYGYILSQMIMAVIDGSWSRLKACDDSKCMWAFYDSSKNKSGRWCSMAVCGSRDKARAYRRRQTKK